MYKIRYSIQQGDTTYVAFTTSMDVVHFYTTHFMDVSVEELDIHVGQAIRIHDHSDDYHGKIGTVVCIHSDHYLNVAVNIPTQICPVIVLCDMADVRIIPTIDPLKSTPSTM